MTQRTLGEAIGLTFQQVQKYEYGANRIGSGRLYEFSRVLGVPVSYFFDRMPANALDGMGKTAGKNGFGDMASPFADGRDPLASRETRELVEAYYRIREARLRRRIYELLRTAGAVSHADKLAKEKQGARRAAKRARSRAGR